MSFLASGVRAQRITSTVGLAGLALSSLATAGRPCTQPPQAVDPGPQARLLGGFDDAEISSAVLSLDGSTIAAVGTKRFPASGSAKHQTFEGVAFVCLRRTDWKPESVAIDPPLRSCSSVDASADGARLVINSTTWIDRSLATCERIDVGDLHLESDQGFRGRRLDGTATHLVVVDLGTARAPQARRSILLLTRDPSGRWSRRVVASADRYPQCGEPVIDEAGGLVLFTAKLEQRTAATGTDRIVYLWRASDDSVVALTPTLREGPVQEWRVPVLSPSGTHFGATMQVPGRLPGVDFSTAISNVWVGVVPTKGEADTALAKRPDFHGACMDIADDVTVAVLAPSEGAHEAGHLPFLCSGTAGAESLPLPDGLATESVLLHRVRTTISRDGRAMLATFTTYSPDESNSSARRLVLYE